MKSRTHIHYLPDDILVRILWQSKHPTRWESDPDGMKYTVWPWQNEFCGIHSVERDVFFDDCDPIAMPSPSANAAWNLLISSVCRRWRCIARHHVSTLLVKPSRVVSRQDLAQAVSCFPSLTHLHLCRDSVETLDDAFLSHLATSCPKLTAFHVGGGITPSHFDARKDLHPITEAGLDRFFLQYTNLEQLSLFCLHEDVKLPPSFFQLTRLQALVLPDAAALNSPEFKNISSLTSLWITSHKLEYQQLAALTCISSLTSLRIPYKGRPLRSDQPAAFTLSQLHRLETLKFDQSCPPFNLIFPPETSCTSLEQLLITSSDALESLPDDIADLLPCLRELDIRNCKKLMQLPEGFTSLSRLESLKISGPDSRFILPDNFGFLPALRTLLLDSLPFSHLPDSFCQLRSLETLVLKACKQLFQLPVGFCSLTALKILCLLELSCFVLPDDIGMLGSLQIFRLTESFKQRQLPSSLTQLTSLTGIEIDTCSYMSELPEGLDNLANLQQLHIRNCPIVELPESITHLTKLEYLTVVACSRLLSVPRNLTPLTRLKGLVLIIDKPLNRRFEVLPPSLEIMSWGSYKRVIPLPDISNLPSLTALKWIAVGAKRGLAVSRSLSRLQHLELLLTKTATKLPFLLKSMDQLRSLSIYRAVKLQQLPADFGSALPRLRELKIQEAGELKELPASLSELRHLTSLEVIQAPNLTSLPEAVGSLTRLKKLKLAKCSSLEMLPASLDQLVRLHMLEVTFSALRFLPSGLARLTALRKMQLRGCLWLQVQPEEFLKMRMLRYLGVSPNLDIDKKRFPEAECFRKEYGLNVFMFPLEYF